MANPFPFVSGSVLLAAQLNGIGETAVSFTPTIGNYTRGNGTSVAFRMRVNKLVYVYVEETLGSTSSVTGEPSLTLPFTAARLRAIPLSTNLIVDAGTNVFFGTTQPTGTNSVSLRLNSATGSFVSFGFINATTPMTWATGDSFATAFVYEAA